MPALPISLSSLPGIRTDLQIVFEHMLDFCPRHQLHLIFHSFVFLVLGIFVSSRQSPGCLRSSSSVLLGEACFGVQSLCRPYTPRTISQYVIPSTSPPVREQPCRGIAVSSGPAVQG